MLAVPYSELKELGRKIGVPLERLHDLLGIDVTDRGYPNEKYDNILPYPEPAETTMKLGLIDQFVPGYWTTTLFSFPACGTKLNDTKLKSSLAQALGILPALSGRIVTKEGKPYNFRDHKRDLQINLTCHERGAWFTSVESDFDFKELHKDLFSFEVHEPNFIFSRAQRAVVEMQSPPLLAVKITHYKCGSALMCVMTSHVVNDGRSTYLFMKLWGQLYRSLKPSFIHDTRLSYRGEKKLSNQGQALFEAWSQPFPSDNQPTFPFKTVRFSITKQNMSALKQSCNAQYDQGYISTDDLFCAVVWRAILRSRQFKNETLASFQRVLDVRENYGLSIDSAYGCGIIWFTHKNISIAKALSMPIHELALTFRTTLNENSTNFVHDFLTAASHLSLTSYATRINNISTGPNVAASSYSKFVPSQINFNTPADINIRIPHPPGQFHTYAPTKSHYYGLVGLATEHIPNILNDNELLSLGFVIEVAPFKVDFK